jgi:hypothetical protein
MKNKFWEPPLPPGITLFWVDKMGNGLFKGPKTSDMTFKGWGRCLKVTLKTRSPQNSTSVDGGPSGASRMRRPVSEDPHQR